MDVRIAIRFLMRQKMHSLINLLGPGIGLAVAVLVGVYVRDAFRAADHYPNGRAASSFSDRRIDPGHRRHRRARGPTHTPDGPVDPPRFRIATVR